MATAILEVLGGARTVTDAASALGISPPRYYQLESRALEGLVQACERRDRGPRTSPEQEAERLRKELVRVKKDLARQQALARAAQRAVGLAAVQPERSPAKGSAKGRCRKKPSARALRAVRRLQSGTFPENPGATESRGDGDASTPAAAS